MSSSSSSSEAGLFPAGTTPENRVERASSLCSLGWRPHLMTGTLRQHLIEHFASKDEIEDPSLRDYLWESGVGTDIVIESLTRWRPNLASARPAIIIKRNGWQVERRGINDQHMGNLAVDGYDRYSTFMTGSHTLFCLSPLAGECEKLAAEIYRWLIWFFPQLRRDLKLHRLVVAEVGALSEVEESNEHYLVPITVAYAHEESWVIKPHAPRLKRVVLEYFEP